MSKIKTHIGTVAKRQERAGAQGTGEAEDAVQGDEGGAKGATKHGDPLSYKGWQTVFDGLNLPLKLKWSQERAGNGEPFLEGQLGIDLVKLPPQVFEAIGMNPIPFRLTPSMVAHVYERHMNELRLKSPEEAASAILGVMKNFDHVRRQNDGTIIFSIENGRRKAAKRAVTIVLAYDKGEWKGIKTMGYETVTQLRKVTPIWEEGENQSPSAGVAPANVTSAQPSHSDKAASIA